MAFVDHMLGGSGVGSSQPGRMTGMEGRIIRQPSEAAARRVPALRSTPMIALTPTLDVIEYNPHWLRPQPGRKR